MSLIGNGLAGRVFPGKRAVVFGDVDGDGAQRAMDQVWQRPAVRDPVIEGDPDHGGLNETAAMLHLHPRLVDMAQARRSVPEHLTTYEHIGFGKPVSFGWSSDDFGTGDGVIGDPTGATPELGHELVDAAIAANAAALRECARFLPGRPTTS
ncbi:creatininase family protein [Nonomuraea sp. H19]|uniref:creatininase family protein n=1 Tax=Nonomuraea sp. H19 TaxID=3452206 RepID=UPI003F8BC967